MPIFQKNRVEEFLPKNTFHFFSVIFLDPSTINNARCETLSPEEFDFQLSPTPVTFRWTLIKEPVFLVDQARPRSIGSIEANRSNVRIEHSVRSPPLINAESRLPRIDYPASVRLDAHADEYGRKRREFRIFLPLNQNVFFRIFNEFFILIKIVYIELKGRDFFIRRIYIYIIEISKISNIFRVRIEQ